MAMKYCIYCGEKLARIGQGGYCPNPACGKILPGWGEEPVPRQLQEEMPVTVSEKKKSAAANENPKKKTGCLGLIVKCLLYLLIGYFAIGLIGMLVSELMKIF